MAKTEISRSQKIRDYKAANPGAKAADIQSGLKKEGVKVTKVLIYNALRGTKKKRRRRRKAAAVAESNGVPSTPKDAISLNSLVEAKKLVASLGSIDEATRALKALQKLG